LGVDLAHPFQLVHVKTRDGQIKENASVQATVKNSQLELHLEFTNVEAGDLVVFSIDVDEVLWFDPSVTDIQQINEGLDSIVSGAEFHGTFFRTEFSAPHYHDLEAETTFVFRYDSLLESANALLPPDQQLTLPRKRRAVRSVANSRSIPQRSTNSTSSHDLGYGLSRPKPEPAAGNRGG
jgi:serine-aspartate repeat-containing protein C/D/E